ncbi:Glyoxalase/Bleomycin resistance protein/Dioxygenase superfamily protein [Noviherbaspirillum humi]|uniref:Glyoxalase/Bleomycin resistance protein/Dioxygenase superfamily protein n=1 Tax=Noviherbaspirillum humi TaxID=1688639 RepID=A0A239I5I3_9BURK|nr:VOC family protein [Noviherbaspirillum humi]SNS88875.1 Glyoxalase/Bleomycin resistance protein/Dioxygenase superfamily protein [Noviherbaspirillum humi]
MNVLGIDEITYGADDLPLCKRFFTDWGMKLAQESADTLVFESLNGCRVIVRDRSAADLPPAIEDGPTLREVVWGVADQASLQQINGKIQGLPGYVNQRDGGRVGCTDPNGLAVRFQVTRKHEVDLECAQMNTWSNKPRRNQRSKIYDHAEPIEVGHVVFFVKDVKACEAFYAENFGFVASDRYPGRGAFLRCAPEGGHHDLFLLQTPEGRAGLNHVAFAVRDIHEVFGGGMNMSRLGWETQLGPGRHPISSAYFWYFRNPAGGLIEYYTDEDHLDAEWEPREFEPGPTVFAEWAIEGGIDGQTRRQRNADAPSGKFLTEKPKS